MYSHNNQQKNIVAIILAAGNSSRLGRPKQLIQYVEKTLLAHAVDTIPSTNLLEKLVVVGAYERECRMALKDCDTHVISNQNWRNGMGSSIKLALTALLNKYENLDGVLITTCDQPLIPESHYKKLIQTFNQSNPSIIATNFQNSMGVPAIFDKSQFSFLNSIEDMSGAKTLVLNTDDKILVTCDEAQFDLDTVEDILTLRYFEQIYLGVDTL